MVEIPIKCFAVSMVILRKTAKSRKVLLLRRTGTLRGEWCQIAGAIEAGETAWRAALRETTEETRLVPGELYSADICEQFYEADRDAISMLPVFVGFVDGHQKVVLNEEHSHYCWVSFKKALSLVPFAGQRTVLRHIEAEFIVRSPSPYLKIEH